MSEIKFHVNPETGVVGRCRAKKRSCKFKDAPHHSSKEEAESWFEQQKESDTFKKLSKTSKRDEFKSSDEVDSDASGSPSKVYVFPDEAETREFKSKSGTVTMMISDKNPTASTPNHVEAWLTLDNGENVSFMKVLVHNETYNPELGPHLSMCDIETRVDSRGKGYARELRESVENETGLLIYSSGSYTPEGWDAFHKHARVDSNDPYARKIEKPNFDSMGFVASWKHRVPLNTSRRIEYTDEQSTAMWELSEKGVFQKFRDGEILWATE